jgi:hypothetical protein
MTLGLYAQVIASKNGSRRGLGRDRCGGGLMLMLPRQVASGADDAAIANAEPPVVLRLALAVVKAVSSRHLGSTNRGPEARDEVVHPNRTGHDIFADSADRARGLAGAAVRIARSVSRGTTSGGGLGCTPGGRFRRVIASTATRMCEGSGEANDQGRNWLDRSKPRAPSQRIMATVSQRVGRLLSRCGEPSSPAARPARHPPGAAGIPRPAGARLPGNAVRRS